MNKLLFILVSTCPFVLFAAGASKNYSWGTIQQGNLCLTGGGDKAPSAVTFETCTASNKQQKWLYSSNDFTSANGMSGVFRYQTNSDDVSSTCLDVPTDSGGKAGANLHMWKCGSLKGTPSMQWKIDVVPNKNAGPRFQIKSLYAPENLCLQSNGASRAPTIDHCSGSTSGQIFDLNPNYAFASAYLHEAGINFSKWMEQIYASKPNTLLKDIIIPGSHDSGSFEGMVSISITQSKSFYDQLVGGIRNFDFRIDDSMYGLVITHGLSWRSAPSLENAFADINKFVKANRREIIIVNLNEMPTKKDSAMTKLKAMIDQYLTPYAIDGSNSLKVQDISFNKMWSTGKNLILLGVFPANSDDKRLGSIVWNKNNFETDIWPDSRTFSEIEGKNRAALQARDHNKWHLSQLIRTPVGLTPNPAELTGNATADGIFALQIDKWVRDWAIIDKLPVNIVITDFFEWSNLVPMTVLINYLRAK